jgi:hypothetical protein
MDATTGALVAISALIAWGLIRIGVRIGAARASRYIVGGFAEALGLKSTAQEMDETSQCLSVQRPWHSVVDFQESHERIMRSAAIGEALAQVGLAAGVEMHQPKPGESLVKMNRKDLESIAWLADYGLRVWTMPRDNGVRHGERLTKDLAEQMSDALDKFERKLTPWSSETEDERERRFASNEDRMNEFGNTTTSE